MSPWWISHAAGEAAASLMRKYRSFTAVSTLVSLAANGHTKMGCEMGLSENVGLRPPMIASHFSKRDNDQQNHWVQWGTQDFQTNPNEDCEHKHKLYVLLVFRPGCNIEICRSKRMRASTSKPSTISTHFALWCGCQVPVWSMENKLKKGAHGRL